VVVGVSPDSLLLTPGSDGAIRVAFEAFVEHGDRVVHTFPTFAIVTQCTVRCLARGFTDPLLAN